MNNIEQSTDDTLVPLDQIARHVAHDKWCDMPLCMAAEAWEMAHSGEPKPLLNGKENDRAMLAHLQGETEERIQRLMDTFVDNGQLTLRDAVGLPTSQKKGAWVLKSDLLELIASNWKPDRHTQAQDWMQRVRDKATDWCSDRNEGGFPKPTKKAVCEEMAVWCRNENIVTDTGIFPSAETLRRHVLRGWTVPCPTVGKWASLGQTILPKP